MNTFTYEYPVKQYFGEKAAANHLPAELAKVGKTVMLAYGGGSIKRTGIYDELVEILKDAGKEVVEFTGIMSNPTYAKVQEGAALAKEKQVDFILAVGGGSVSDCCKIVATQAKYEQDIWEMEYTDHQIPTEHIPMGVVVTASGTGSEQNNGAVITHEEKKLKAALWGAYAAFAILDPAYTLSVPMKQVISGAFDTLSHAMETYFGQPEEVNLSDELGEAVMRNTIRNIRKVIENPKDVSARSELMWASAMAENGILKIGKVTDFQGHMIEHQVGAYTDCNHGQGLAVIHPHLYRTIYRDALSKFARFAKEVWNVDDTGKSEDEVAQAGIQALADFIKEIGLPTTFAEMNVTLDDDMVRKIAESTVFTAGCCKKLTVDDIERILIQCK
ncbi:NADH-dependent butanol dehydrogenase A [Lachnospiraceae bacterium TWA4]|nr:NADH-dependent butanol dehydrogenase A [Lachnospiraceae bacterium TWA4]